MRKRFRPVVVGYLVLALATIGALAQGQALSRESLHRICVATQASWDERNQMVLELTQPVTLSPQAAATDLGGALKVQIAAGNEHRKAERVHLLELQGPRPHC